MSEVQKGLPDWVEHALDETYGEPGPSKHDWKTWFALLLIAAQRKPRSSIVKYFALWPLRAQYLCGHRSEELYESGWKWIRFCEKKEPDDRTA